MFVDHVQPVEHAKMVSFQRRLGSSDVASLLKLGKSLGPSLRWGDVLSAKIALTPNLPYSE